MAPQQRCHRSPKEASTLGNGVAAEVKIRGFTRGSRLPGKIYKNPAAITIDIGAEVRKELVES